MYRQRAGWHEALYDRSRVRYLLALLRAIGRREVEHTIDGEDWSAEWVPWACFVARLDGDPRGWRSVHLGAKCDSLWGCVLAQDRQDPYLHARRGEVFWHDRHGRFALPPEKEAWIRSHARPAEFRRWLEEAPWGFDRRAIRVEMMRLIRAKHGHRCPMFAVSYLEKRIMRLPEVVMVHLEPERYEVVVEPGTRVGLLWRCYEDRTVVADPGNPRLLPPPDGE